jgi:hypothetical protein
MQIIYISRHLPSGINVFIVVLKYLEPIKLVFTMLLVIPASESPKKPLTMLLAPDGLAKCTVIP